MAYSKYTMKEIIFPVIGEWISYGGEVSLMAPPSVRLSVAPVWFLQDTSSHKIPLSEYDASTIKIFL